MKNINFRRAQKLLTCLKEAQWRKPLLYGVAAAVEHEKFFRNIIFSTVVDVGANTGQFSLIMRKNNPDAEIFAFEPLSAPIAVYEKIFQHDDKVVTFNHAIAPNTGELSMNVSQSIDSSSLLEISALQDELFPGTYAVNSEKIRMGPLDEFLDRSQIMSQSLLKIDVQGFELEVLRGCKSLLDCFQMVYCECSFCELYTDQALAYEVINFMYDLGFHLQGFNNAQYDNSGRTIQADFIFIKNSQKFSVD
jgi:FkbM family methyltransferase